MARLHQRGIDLLLNIQTALDHTEEITAQELRALLKEAEVVLRDLLARDAVDAKSGRAGDAHYN